MHPGCLPGVLFVGQNTAISNAKTGLLTITGSRVLGVRPHFVWVDLQLQNVIPD
jgi:hypothetical protein